MKRLLYLLTCLLIAISFCSGCVPMQSQVVFQRPQVLYASEMVPSSVRSQNQLQQFEFAVNYDRFMDDRSNRAVLGYSGQSAAITTDKDIAEVFETVVKKSFERKGIRQGASALLLKGSIQSAAVGSRIGTLNESGQNIKAQVAVELSLFDSRNKARLWSKTYNGQGIGIDYTAVMASAFTDLMKSIDNDDGVLAFKNVYSDYLATRSDHGPAQAFSNSTADTGEKTPMEKEIEIGDAADTHRTLKADNFAVVIGIEKYRDIRGVEFAASDAVLVKEYLTRLMGYPKENVILLTNERATKGDIEKYIGKWLKNRVSEESSIFIYYAGHGAPNPTTGEAFLVPFDGDPAYLETTAYPLKTLYSSLSEMPAKKIIVALDSCFSGAGGRSVIARGARPLVMMSDTPRMSDNIIVLAASKSNQISTFYEKGRHGLFTYYLLRGLKGEATDKDGSITIESLYKYLQGRVEKEAKLQNIEQTPVVLPDMNALADRRNFRLR